MLTVVRSISSLLIGASLLLVGNGLVGTLLGLRAAAEGFPDRVIGLVMSAYFLGFLAGTLIAPRLVVRIGHIRAFTLFAAVASVTAILHALAVSPLVWALLRIVTGSCLVALYMVIESWLNTLAPAERRGQVFAIYMAVNFLSLAAGQNLIRLYAPTGFELFGVVAMLFSLSLAPIALTRIRQPTPVRTPRLRLRELYVASPAGLFGALGSGVAMSAFWGLGPVMARGLGFDTGQVASVMTATILGGALAQWPVGYWSDRHDRRRVLAALSTAASALAFGAYAASSIGPGVLMLALLMFGGLAFTIYPVSVALANDTLGDDRVLQGASTLLLVHGIGAAAGPSIAGTLMSAFGPHGLLMHFTLSFALLATAVWWHVAQSDETLRPQAHFAPMVRTSSAALELIVPEGADTAPLSCGDPVAGEPASKI